MRNFTRFLEKCIINFRFGEQIFPKVRVYGARSVSGLPVAGVNMRDVISIAFGPDTRIIPMAPPWAVAMAQIVSGLSFSFG